MYEPEDKVEWTSSSVREWGGRQADLPSTQHMSDSREQPPMARALFSEALGKHGPSFCPSSCQSVLQFLGEGPRSSLLCWGSERGTASAFWLLKSWELLLWAPGSNLGQPSGSPPLAMPSDGSLPTTHRTSLGAGFGGGGVWPPDTSFHCIALILSLLLPLCDSLMN